MTDLPQVNLVAVVGRGGAIGPDDGPPMMTHREDAEWFQEWFWDLTADGVIVLGGRSFRWFVEQCPTIGSRHIVAAWSRENRYVEGSGKSGPVTPEDFLKSLSVDNKPVFICGGRETYRTFIPFVTQFFLRRVAINPPYDNYMPPLFERTQ